MFDTYLQEKKSLLLAELKAFITKQKSQTNSSASSWGTDALNRIAEYMENGKMIRGTLVFLGYEMTMDKKNDDLVKLALAMELFHAGLLVHDDIMDNADTRRGKPAIHAAYADLLAKKQFRYPKNSGRWMAICVGNTAFFLAEQLIADVSNQEIASFFAKELQIVNFAQMQDVALGATNKPVDTIDEILSLYEQKTGRYSVLVPLTAGAMFAGTNTSTIKHIAQFAKSIGIAYQLVDDNLDLFGDTRKTGKVIGTDIREGKQTVLIHLLRKCGDADINKKISDLFAKGEITDDDVRWVQTQVRNHHINTDISHMIETYRKEAGEAIAKVPMKDEYKARLLSFVDYLTNRIQ